MEKIKIGNQIWMQSNLNVDAFRNNELVTHENYNHQKNNITLFY